jgi:N-acyl-D-aspartate/D-glutamate deacylase
LTVHSSGNYAELEKYVGRTLGEIAEEEGKHHIEVMLDLSVASDLNLSFIGAPTASADPEKVSELMKSPYVIAGVSDGGAHTKFLAGGSYTTDFIAWLVRENGKLTLEEAHYLMSYFPAHAAGLKNRGFLREGAAADVVIYDYSTIRREPEWELVTLHDVPAGEWRRVQFAEGIHWILVNGVVTFKDDECTGATPGKLFRANRTA